ncbi:DnaJ -like protein subfamily B member 5 [Capsicum chinense]|nr:DnaJ -like protein subfamily B member 5 [Capsicum chinense]
MEHHTTTSRAEAERLLGVAEKLLREKDFAPCKDFALLAQETEPLLEGPDQILAIAEVLLASSKRINNHHDWYSILQIQGRTEDSELIKKQYRRLALLLHPDKNKYPSSDVAFGLVADAWAVLSDPNKKGLYDNELSLFTRVNLVPGGGGGRGGRGRPRGSYNKHKKGDDKLPVRRSSRASGNSGQNTGQSPNPNPTPTPPPPKAAPPTPVSSGIRGQRVVNFWTSCPYCYNLYEYPRVYEGCCLRCDKCKRAFTATEILTMPPLVPGREAYYCIWGFFPMGFVTGNMEELGNGKGTATDAAAAATGAFPTWMPPMFSSDGNANVNVAIPNATPPGPVPVQAAAPAPAPAPVRVQAPVSAAPRPMSSTGPKKRGRPRKYN